MTTSAVSLDLTKAFDTVSYTILGSLSNDDGAATRTAKKKRFIKQNNNFARAAHFFLYISLPLVHEYDVKMPNFTFMLEVKTRQRFSFSFCELRNRP